MEIFPVILDGTIKLYAAVLPLTFTLIYFIHTYSRNCSPFVILLEIQKVVLLSCTVIRLYDLLIKLYCLLSSEEQKISVLSVCVVSRSTFHNGQSLSFIKQCLSQSNSAHFITQSISSEGVQCNQVLWSLVLVWKTVYQLITKDIAKDLFYLLPCNQSFSSGIINMHGPTTAHSYLNRL